MMRKTLTGALILALWALPLTAQEDDQDLERWNAEAGLTLQASGGNESLTVFTATVGLGHLQPDVFELSTDGRLRYGESEGEKVAHNLRGDVMMDLWPAATWSPFLFATGEQDPIKKLESRLNGGVGAKRTFWQDGWSEVSTSAAVLYSYEDLEVPDTLADTLGNGVTQTARWSWRVRGRLEMGEGSRLEQVLFFQPAWDRLKDYQLESVTKLRIAINKTLSFNTEVLYQRDNTPAPEVGPDDYSISVGLSMATEW